MNTPQAIMFDMDGLLIDSEPLWRGVEVDIFNKYGVPLTHEKCRETMGLRIDEAVEYWFKQYPWTEKSVSEVSQEIIDGVIVAIRNNGEAKKGVPHVLKESKKFGVPLALVSSSSMKIIEACIEKLQLQDIFELLYSAEMEPFGKPHPGVYLSALKKLQVQAEQSVAFEDSLNGVKAAKAANMKCIAVPDAFDRAEKNFDVADKILNSLEEFNEQVISNL